MPSGTALSLQAVKCILATGVKEGHYPSLADQIATADTALYPCLLVDSITVAVMIG